MLLAFKQRVEIHHISVLPIGLTNVIRLLININ